MADRLAPAPHGSVEVTVAVSEARSGNDAFVWAVGEAERLAAEQGRALDKTDHRAIGSRVVPDAGTVVLTFPLAVIEPGRMVEITGHSSAVRRLLAANAERRVAVLAADAKSAAEQDSALAKRAAALAEAEKPKRRWPRPDDSTSASSVEV